MLKETMSIYAVPDSQESIGFKFKLIPQEKKWWMHDEDICVGEVEVEYDPPSDMTKDQLVLKAIETLKDKQTQAMASAQVKYNELQEKINKLTLISHNPSDVDDSIIEHDKGDDEILL